MKKQGRYLVLALLVIALAACGDKGGNTGGGASSAPFTAPSSSLAAVASSASAAGVSSVPSASSEAVHAASSLYSASSQGQSSIASAAVLSSASVEVSSQKAEVSSSVEAQSASSVASAGVLSSASGAASSQSVEVSSSVEAQNTSSVASSLAASVSSLSAEASSSPLPASSSTSSAAPVIKQVSTVVTGTLHEEAVYGGTLRVTLDDLTFNAPIGADGTYRVELTAPEASAGVPIRWMAKGAGDKAYVELLAATPSLNELATRAKAGVVDVDVPENYGFSVSVLSTAKAGMAGVESHWPQTDEALGEAMTHAYPEASLFRAAAIQGTIFNKPYLPVGASTTLKLAANSNWMDELTFKLKENVNVFLPWVKQVEDKAAAQSIKPTSLQGWYHGEIYIANAFVSVNFNLFVAGDGAALLQLPTGVYSGALGYYASTKTYSLKFASAPLVQDKAYAPADWPSTYNNDSGLFETAKGAYTLNQFDFQLVEAGQYYMFIKPQVRVAFTDVGKSETREYSNLRPYLYLSASQNAKSLPFQTAPGIYYMNAYPNGAYKLEIFSDLSGQLTPVGKPSEAITWSTLSQDATSWLFSGLGNAGSATALRLYRLDKEAFLEKVAGTQKSLLGSGYFIPLQPEVANSRTDYLTVRHYDWLWMEGDISAGLSLKMGGFINNFTDMAGVIKEMEWAGQPGQVAKNWFYDESQKIIQAPCQEGDAVCSPKSVRRIYGKNGFICNLGYAGVNYFVGCFNNETHLSFGPWFYGNDWREKVFLRENGLQVDAVSVNMKGGKLKITAFPVPAHATYFEDTFWNDAQSFTPENGKLLITEPGATEASSVWEIIETTSKGVKVCQYPVNTQCANDTFWLEFGKL